MPTDKLDRLYFAQGKRCFFCDQALAIGDASVEHLVAVTNKGSNNDGNCVVCCKAMNHLLGSHSLKEKFRIVMNQRGEFVCPAKVGKPKAVAKPKVVAKPAAKKATDLDRVIADLRKRGNARPGTLPKLRNALKTFMGNGTTDAEADKLIQGLTSRKVVAVTGENVTYTFPD